MTAQIPERLVYQEEDFRLCSEPLEEYFQKLGHRPKFPPMNTGCWRGYIGTWEIKDDKLYLAEIRMGEGGRPWGKVLNAEERELWDVIDEMNKCQVTPETLFPGQSPPIFASWFTGILRLVQGNVIDYIHASYESTYEREFLLRVENGVVIGDPVQSVKPGNRL